ncbi:MAG: 30S ribosomal protein S20 [Dethiobacter sp.]|nr:MAG: 30S ribosomal protein S20 [Dethiobacter sp.]
MPNTKSAFKRMKQSLLRRQRNRGVKSHLKNAVQTFHVSLKEQDLQKARQTYAAASSVIDKAVSKGVIHKNTGARKKSRLAKQLNELVS